MVCLGSKGMDHVIKGQFYIGHFPIYNSFSKFDSKNVVEPQHDHVISNSMNYLSYISVLILIILFHAVHTMSNQFK